MAVVKEAASWQPLHHYNTKAQNEDRSYSEVEFEEISAMERQQHHFHALRQGIRRTFALDSTAQYGLYSRYGLFCSLYVPFSELFQLSLLSYFGYFSILIMIFSVSFDFHIRCLYGDASDWVEKGYIYASIDQIE